ncbi:uncharacterized protein METZ01_LOCUS347967, partial [marine metagenome]
MRQELRSWSSTWPIALAFALIATLSLPGNVFAAEPGDDDEPTYSMEVSRIFQANCQICHQPGQIGPMSLLTYQDARRYARRIRSVVALREMPPYQYDHDVGIQELQQDWRMSEEDIQTILDWVDAGAPEGDPDDLPEPLTFPDMNEWRLGDEYGQP